MTKKRKAKNDLNENKKLMMSKLNDELGSDLSDIDRRNCIVCDKVYEKSTAIIAPKFFTRDPFVFVS